MPTKNILLLSIPIFLIMISSIGLALTIKYSYIDEIKHFHTNTCYINNCTITTTECCSRISKRKICSTCYDVDVNYNLYLLNNYSKTSIGTVYNSNFCNQTNIDCYYDDRNISQSLTPFDECHVPGIVVVGIIFLSLFLLIMIIIIIHLVINYCDNNRFIENDIMIEIFKLNIQNKILKING